MKRSVPGGEQGRDGREAFLREHVAMRSGELADQSVGTKQGQLARYSSRLATAFLRGWCLAKQSLA